MKTLHFKSFRSAATCLFLLASMCFGLDRSASGQGCDLAFQPYPANILTSYITQYPYYDPHVGPTDPLISTFLVDVTNIVNHTNYNNPPIPYGLYPAWCVDEWVKISPPYITVPGGLYTGELYSTCDPNLNSELPPGHPNTMVSPSVWQMVNYILNHQTYNGSNAFYWNVQDAINTLVGSAVGAPNPCGGTYTTPAPDGGCENYPVFNPVVVNALLTAASNNAPTWVPRCGDVIGAIYVTSPTNQFIMLEVPVPCAPCIGVTKQVACLQPGNTCGAYGQVAQGYAGVTCSNTPDSPAFCYEISITNCGTIPLTNVTVYDNLLGNLTSNFFSSPTNVFEPGAFVTAYFSMAFATNATNNVLVQGAAALPGTVTNGTEVFTNGTPVAATASAIALVTPAAVACNISLSSPYVNPTNNGGNVLMLPEIVPGGDPVTVSVTVMNTGGSSLSGVTITPVSSTNFTCNPPPPFNLAPGASTNIILCSNVVVCPADENFSISVNGVVDSDPAHCGVFDLSGNSIMVCSSCAGTVECSPTGGCSITNELAGTVVLDCVVGATNLSGDTGLIGVPVSLYGSASNLLATTTTDNKGNYSFVSLGSGTYTVVITLPAGYTEIYPAGVTNGQQTVTVVACENTIGVNFGLADTNPPQIIVPPGQYLNCNPTSLPTDSNIASTVTATVSCGTPTITVTHSDSNTACSFIRTYMITVTDTYGNVATSNIVYSWISNSTPLVITGTPTNSYLGCNPATLPTAFSVTNGVSAGNACGTAPLSVTNVLTTNGCTITDTFIITAIDACGNTGASRVVYTWTANATPLVITGTPTNSYLGCNPATLPTAFSVTNGVSAGNACGTAPLSVTNVLTTNGCTITDTFIITAIDACGNTGASRVVYTWTANATPLVITGTPTNSNLGCNPATLPTAFSVTNGLSAANACGTAPLSVTNMLSTNGCTITDTFIITAVDACGNTGTSSVVYTWTANATPLVITGTPANSYLGCNPATLPTAFSVTNGVTASNACGSAPLNVNNSLTTAGCYVTNTFTITATDGCGNRGTSRVVYSWITNTTPPTIVGVPTNTFLGCTTSANLPSDNTISNALRVVAACGTATLSVTHVDRTSGCNVSRVFTITATDSCGNVATAHVTYTATVLSAAPMLSGCPMNTNIQCVSEIPGPVTVTATDSCGTVLPVVYSQHQSNPTSSCSNVITRIWTATDCAGQMVSCTQVITQWDNIAPIITYTPITNSPGTNNGGTNIYCSVTQGGWGAPPHRGNPAGLLASNFASIYPHGVSIGITSGPGYFVKFTSAAAIQAFLPAGGTPAALTSSATNPVSTSAGVFAGQVLALQLNVDFDNANLSGNGSPIGALVYNDASSPLNGLTISQILAMANIALGGGTTPVSLGDLQNIADELNNAFDGCNADGFANQHLLTQSSSTGSLPTDGTISNAVTVTGNCGPATYTVTHVDLTNGCSVTRTFTITATDTCGNMATDTVTFSLSNNVGPTVTCPPDVTIITNFCQMYCTFGSGDWSGSCDGGYRNNNNWWQNWCGQNSPSQCWPSWTNWWSSCGANNNQCNNWWDNWNNNHPTSCWGSWSGNQGGRQSDSWWNSWNSCNRGSQNWVPCSGTNPDTVLGNCFNAVYPKGCITVGRPDKGKCLTVTSCSSAQTCLNWTGNPGILNNCATNPSSCNAGSFCAQVLALKLNCDFGDYGCIPGFAGKCGDLVLCDSTSPCNGKKVRDILGECNDALGGESCPQGCSVQYLCGLCSNLNQSFRGCQVSSWCSNHLCSIYIPTPAQTGTATFTAGCCSNVTLTNCDTITKGNCQAGYVINREWIVIDACGNSNTCTQLITILGKSVTNQICGNFNSQNPASGYVWCNAHLSCNPGKACNVYCQNASVTLTCNDGRTYTYPVPDCQINFNPNCTSSSCVFDGKKWTTTLPCTGDDEIFLSGCGIPWKSDFANCRSVCWSGNFSCDTTGVNCNWQWSGACYRCDLSDCGSVSVKPCHNVPCGYPSGDHAGTPENCKPYCQGGACGGGGSNYTGSWSGTGSWSCDGSQSNGGSSWNERSTSGDHSDH